MDKRPPWLLDFFTIPQLHRMINIRKEVIADHTSKYPLTHFDFPSLAQLILNRMIPEVPLSNEEEITIVKEGLLNMVKNAHWEQLQEKGFRLMDLELRIIKENGVATYRDLMLMVPKYLNMKSVEDSMDEMTSRNRGGVKNLPRRTNEDCDKYAKEIEFWTQVHLEECECWVKRVLDSCL